MPMRRIVSLKVLDWWRGEPADMPRDPAALDEAIDDAYASTLALDAPSTLERWHGPPTPRPASARGRTKSTSKSLSPRKKRERKLHQKA